MDYEITAEEVKAKLDAGDAFTLLDVREPWEFEDHIVVVCHHGVRSMNVTAWLRQQGFEKAQSMRGGIDAWARTVDQKVQVY
jgi:rhodanese-related sulfurtransferase